MEPHAARALRAFYRKALKGRQVWPAGIESRASLWFLVAGVLIEVTDAAGAKRSLPIVLDVEDPDALARRCWDAGFTVRVNQDNDAASVSVFDPFGRRIDLVEANREDVTPSRVRQR